MSGVGPKRTIIHEFYGGGRMRSNLKLYKRAKEWLNCFYQL